MSELISVALLTYNGERYLREMLDSIYAQTYGNFEVVASDDCSTDGTAKILEEYEKCYNLRYFSNPHNLGFVRNMERALSLCQGSYIALADYDDVWLPQHLETLYRHIGNNLLVHSDAIVIDGNNNILSPSATHCMGKLVEMNFVDYFITNNVTAPTCLFRAKLLEHAMPIPLTARFPDWWFALNAAKYGRIGYVNKPLTKYRIHGQNMAAAKQEDILNVRERTNRQGLSHRMLAFYEAIYCSFGDALSESEREFLDDLTLFHRDFLEHAISLRGFYVKAKYFSYYLNRERRIFPKRSLVTLLFLRGAATAFALLGDRARQKFKF